MSHCGPHNTGIILILKSFFVVILIFHLVLQSSSLTMATGHVGEEDAGGGKVAWSHQPGHVSVCVCVCVCACRGVGTIADGLVLMGTLP